jgi:hypothetical protein
MIGVVSTLCLIKKLGSSEATEESIERSVGLYVTALFTHIGWIYFLIVVNQARFGVLFLILVLSLALP